MTGVLALASATASLVDGPGVVATLPSAGVLEGISLVTGGIATGADWVNGHTTEAKIGMVELTFGAVAPAAGVVSKAYGGAVDVAEALGWSTDLGAIAAWLSGELN